MKRATTLFVMLVIAGWQLTAAQSTEYISNPERTGELTDAFAVYSQNGARSVSGPYDLDQDGLVEILVTQHSAGGRVHVIENTDVDTWELVYSTALIDSTDTSFNARHATAGDMDNDGNWEIIYVGGTLYSQFDQAWPVGLYVWEHDGVVGSDNYGEMPASVVDYYTLDGRDQGSAYSQQVVVDDVDGDGIHEALVPSNGPSALDVFYILSVTPDADFETNGFGTTFETWIIEGTEAPRERDIGGGSAYAVTTGDFNGDGARDISWHSWNSFNFFNWTTNGADTYVPLADGDNLQASAADGDYVALFGGTVVDIDGDGTDEAFYPAFQTGNVSVLNYGQGDDVTVVDETRFAYDVIEAGANTGIDAGDSDGDGFMELHVAGPGYSAADRTAGEPSYFFNVVEYNSGDVMDGASYSVSQVNTTADVDTLGFNLVRRDSLGTISSYYETALSKQGSTGSGNDPVFSSDIAFLGDADGDGDNEIALSFQGVDDSLLVYDEVWNVDSLRYDRTVREAYENPVRAFVRIVSMGDVNVATENRLVVPSDYKLSSNYPNPFNPSTTFSITLPVDKAVSVRVYDIQGRLVSNLVDNQHYQAGTYEIQWDGTNSAGVSVASGTYLYTLEYGNFRQTKKMVLLK